LGSCELFGGKQTDDVGGRGQGFCVEVGTSETACLNTSPQVHRFLVWETGLPRRSRILILVLVPNSVRYIKYLIVAGTDKTYMMRLYQPSQPFFSVFHCIEAGRCTVSRSHIEYLGTCLHAKAKASKTTIESTVSVVILE
jgi:hypothetical protein